MGERIECAACERKHKPRASANTSAADAINVPVMILLFNSIKDQVDRLESCQCRKQELNDCESAISIAL